MGTKSYLSLVMSLLLASLPSPTWYHWVPSEVKFLTLPMKNMKWDKTKIKIIGTSCSKVSSYYILNYRIDEINTQLTLLQVVVGNTSTNVTLIRSRELLAIIYIHRAHVLWRHNMWARSEMARAMDACSNFLCGAGTVPGGFRGLWWRWPI